LFFYLNALLKRAGRFLLPLLKELLMKLASRFGRINQIRRERPLTHEELMSHVPSVFGSDKHESRSGRYTYIPTITILESLQREGFEPFFACQTKVRDQSKREHTKHMLRLRRAGQLTGHQVPEIIYSTAMTAHQATRCCRGCFVASVPTVWSAVSHSAKCGCRIKVMSSRR
jgi:hypothetical protein